MKSNTSAKLTLWTSRCITVILIALIFLLPGILRLNESRWSLGLLGQRAIVISYYLCLILILPAMWNIDRLLCNIRQRKVFIWENVRRIQQIRWCCTGVGLLCIPAGTFFSALYFLAVIMLFLAFMISVVKDVLSAAVELREENDLTI